MDKKVKKQILSIISTCETSMFDLVKVREMAQRRGYKELLSLLDEDLDTYYHFINYGE